MRKINRAILCSTVLISLVGCGAVDDTPNSESNTLLQTVATVAENNQAVDVDLTELSGTMVYAEVYDMLYYPENYLGKTIKMDGVFAKYQDDATGKLYYSCVVQDATACCAQGIEFILDDSSAYPDEGDNVCVVGRFETYQEGDVTYCTLKNAQII